MRVQKFLSQWHPEDCVADAFLHSNLSLNSFIFSETINERKINLFDARRHLYQKKCREG